MKLTIQELFQYAKENKLEGVEYTEKSPAESSLKIECGRVLLEENGSKYEIDYLNQKDWEEINSMMGIKISTGKREFFKVGDRVQIVYFGAIANNQSLPNQEG